MSERRHESEPRKSFTLIYSGNNPYMGNLAQELRRLGHEVEIRQAKDAYSFRKNPEERDALLKNTQGTVLSDKTLYADVQAEYPEAINAYSFIEQTFDSQESYAKQFESLIGEIRAKGRVPVLIESRLADHFRELPESVRAEMDAVTLQEETGPLHDHIQTIEKNSHREMSLLSLHASRWAAQAMAKAYDMPVITVDEFIVDRDIHIIHGVNAPITDVLAARGLDTDKVVLLADHHMYYVNPIRPDDKPDDLTGTGFGEVEMVPICTCCFGASPRYLDSLKQTGFHIFETEYQNDIVTNAAKAIVERG